MYLLALTKYERILINKIKNKVLLECKEIDTITDGEAIVKVLERYEGENNARSDRRSRAKNN